MCAQRRCSLPPVAAAPGRGGVVTEGQEGRRCACSLQKTARPLFFKGSAVLSPTLCWEGRAGAAPRLFRHALPLTPSAGGRPVPGPRPQGGELLSGSRRNADAQLCPLPAGAAPGPPPPHGCPPTAGSVQSHPAVSHCASPNRVLPERRAERSRAPSYCLSYGIVLLQVEGGSFPPQLFPYHCFGVVPQKAAVLLEEPSLLSLREHSGLVPFSAGLGDFSHPRLIALPHPASPTAAPTLQTKGPSENGHRGAAAAPGTPCMAPPALQSPQRLLGGHRALHPGTAPLRMASAPSLSCSAWLHHCSSCDGPVQVGDL